MRRTITLFTAMAMMVLVAASVALAAVISCPNVDSFNCRGTSSADTMTGSNVVLSPEFNSGDSIYGLAGNDTLNARGASDNLWGGLGNDKLDGGEQNDFYMFENGWGVDTITADASGIDELDFQRLTQPVVVDLIADPSRDEAKSGINTLNFASTGLIENVSGSPGYDTLSGTNGNPFSSTSGGNYFRGNGGSDKLYGRGGSDYLYGGDMDDVLHGGEGKDNFSGDSGNDTISAVDNGADGYIWCGGGYDTVSYDRNLDVVGSDCEKKTAYPIAAQ